jgi:hypothetical protein
VGWAACKQSDHVLVWTDRLTAQAVDVGGLRRVGVDVVEAVQVGVLPALAAVLLGERGHACEQTMTAAAEICMHAAARTHARGRMRSGMHAPVDELEALVWVLSGEADDVVGDRSVVTIVRVPGWMAAEIANAACGG